MVFSEKGHGQVWRLAGAQALFQTGSVLVMIVGGLAGLAIAPRPEWATAPIATMFLGTVVAMFPASSFMGLRGRRSGFLLGAALGAAGGLIAASGVYWGSLLLLCIGTLLFGAHAAFAQFYRFAAAEVAAEKLRARAIALVLAGGVVAALLGPLLVRLEGVVPGPSYVGTFLIISILAASSLSVLAGLRIPLADLQPEFTTPRRAWRVVVTQRVYLSALFGASTGFGVMILAMTATPLAMSHHHHGLGTSSTVIQLHVLGMFLPSFITGTLIERWGVLRIMLTGVALLAGHVLLTLTGTGFSSFASALVLLGIGWNFLYIGGTSLLTTTYTESEKSAAQATNDLIVFAVGLIGSFSAAPLLETLGWQRLNLVLLPWLCIAAIVIGTVRARQPALLPSPRVESATQLDR